VRLPDWLCFQQSYALPYWRALLTLASHLRMLLHALKPARTGVEEVNSKLIILLWYESTDSGGIRQHGRP
jgi:hypothetical protein